MWGEFEQREGESPPSYALRRRSLPPDHPAHLTLEQYQAFVSAFIAAVERQQRANIKLLKQAGLSDARI